MKFRYLFLLAINLLLLMAVQGDFLLASDENDRYNRGFELWRQQEWNKAITEFEGFLQTYPNTTLKNDAELYLGHSYLSRGKFVDAQDAVIGRQHLDYIIRQGRDAKNYKDACLHYAFSLYSLMNYAEAKLRLTQYINEFPKDESLQYVYYYLGICESHFGNYSVAVDWFNKDLSEYPKGVLKDVCQLDRAVALGKSGKYAEADRDLSNLALNPDYPYASKAYLQRAFLKIDQQKYDEAIQILESFVSRSINVQGAQGYICEAYQYEVHCYLEQGKYEQALKAVTEIERLQGMTPEAALLKVQVLTNLQRFDEANAILTQLKNSQFGIYAGDIIISRQAELFLYQGRWDESIQLLNSLLILQLDPANKSKVNFGYFNSPAGTQQKLRPDDFLDACKTLVLDYASRYSATKQYADDNTMQNAVFNAMYTYANGQPNPSLMNIVKETDAARNKALITPIRPQGTLVVNGGGNSPQGSSGYYPGTVPGQGTGTGQGIGTGQGTLPNQPGQYPGGYPNQPGQGTPAAYPGSYPGSSNQGGRPNAPGAPGFPGTNSGQYNPPGQGKGQPGQMPGSSTYPSSPSSSTKISEADASTIVNQAGALCMNGDYERANEKLLQLLSSSETFWQDCPTIAPAAALMRTNILFKIRNFREAQTMCNLLIREAPQSPQAVDASYYLGFCYDYYAQQDKAIECLERVVNSRIESDFTDDAYYFLGMNQWERKNPAAADECFRKIYRSYKDSDYWGHAVWALAQIEYDARNYEESERLVNEALGNQPDKSIVDWLLFLKGELALKNKDYEKARIAFNAIVTQYPDSQKITMARNRLANLPKKTNSAPDSF